MKYVISLFFIFFHMICVIHGSHPLDEPQTSIDDINQPKAYVYRVTLPLDLSLRSFYPLSHNLYPEMILELTPYGRIFLSSPARLIQSERIRSQFYNKDDTEEMKRWIDPFLK
jgi:hypothetical protein